MGQDTSNTRTLVQRGSVKILVKGVTPNASKIEQQFDPVKDQAAMNAFIQTLKGLGCTILTQPMSDYGQHLKNELEALYGENNHIEPIYKGQVH